MNKLDQIAEKIKKIEEEKKAKVKQVEYSGTSIAIEFVAQIGVGIFLGYKIDQHFNSSPWFLLILLILSLISSIYSIYKKYK